MPPSLYFMKNNKYQNLIRTLKEMQSVILAYSGGTDSAFLLKAIRVSGISALAVSASSGLIPRRNILAAQNTAEEIGVRHRIIETGVLLREEIFMNTPERCFFCKETLFKALRDIAGSEGYAFVLDGSTRDDLGEFRPGYRAVQIYNVRSPLIESGFSKSEIREISRQLGLATWNKPSSPCLATRFPYGRRLTDEALTRVGEAEHFLQSLGLNQFRVRDHGAVARIEAGEEDMHVFLDPVKRAEISATLKSFGYMFISLDIDGYQSGSMDRSLK